MHKLPVTMPLNTTSDLCKLLASADEGCSIAMGRFLVRVRQTRRKLKCTFERLNEKMQTQSFACRRAVWRFKKRPCCRHGVLFMQLPQNACRCMSPESDDESWQHARYMPALDPELKSIVAVPVHKPSFKRLAVLQAEARSLSW